ncbi:MAG: hypothetical protein HQK86_03250 [Nitrospinae bacterium]|nr:hypothetical protein [Nitrospinota bacterium]
MASFNAVVQALDVSLAGATVSVPRSTATGFDGAFLSAADVIGAAKNSHHPFVSSGGNTTPSGHVAIRVGLFGRI